MVHRELKGSEAKHLYHLDCVCLLQMSTARGEPFHCPITRRELGTALRTIQGLRRPELAGLAARTGVTRTGVCPLVGAHVEIDEPVDVNAFQLCPTVAAGDVATVLVKMTIQIGSQSTEVWMGSAQDAETTQCMLGDVSPRSEQWRDRFGPFGCCGSELQERVFVVRPENRLVVSLVTPTPGGRPVRMTRVLKEQKRAPLGRSAAAKKSRGARGAAGGGSFHARCAVAAPASGAICTRATRAPVTELWDGCEGRVDIVFQRTPNLRVALHFVAEACGENRYAIKFRRVCLSCTLGPARQAVWQGEHSAAEWTA